MRTTINIDEHLLGEAKALAAKSGRTLASVVEDALRALISRGRQAREQPFRMIVFKGRPSGLMPGVDLDNNAALLDLMEADDPPLRR
jgi:hypothetical protein